MDTFTNIVLSSPLPSLDAKPPCGGPAYEAALARTYLAYLGEEFVRDNGPTECAGELILRMPGAVEWFGGSAKVREYTQGAWEVAVKAMREMDIEEIVDGESLRD